MEAITITLNGREVSGHSGMTILELARESGINIPTLCQDPHLSPIGACRICLVEDERTGAIMASCVTPIAPGMVINTASPRVLERRKVILKLMLASHPDTCMVCDKGNCCQLRQVASDMGIGWIDYHKIPQSDIVRDVNPFIVRDLSKCILCAKCIRADQELVVEGAIDYMDRGFVSKPATMNNTPLEKSECTFCGTCVAFCPTGAIMEREKPYRGTTTTTIDTTCPFCGCGCSVSLEVKDNLIVRARPGKDSTVNKGALCVKGSYGYDFVHSPERLTTPLARVNGKLEKVSWEKALELVATGLGKIKEAHGPSSLAVLGSSHCTNEENYLLQRFTRCVLGTNNIDNGSRLYSSASRVGLALTVGSPGTTGSLDNMESSKVILVIGANPEVSAPIVSYATKRAVKFKGAKLLLIDPQQTKLASFAHLWLRPKVGTDVALLNGLARVIITDGLLDKELLSQKIDNFEALSEGLKTYTPEYVEKITGVSNQDLRQAARLFGEASKASIVCGNGITQYLNGIDGIMALANLGMLTGNIGHKGGGIYTLQRDCNGQGACDMGALPDYLPGYQAINDAQARKKFGERWGASLPADAGLTALEMIEQAKAGKVKGMYIIGQNPMLSFPNLALVKESLASLDFLVVQDMFLTETAKLTTVVLPAASFAEKEGTFTNLEGRVQRVRRAIKPLGDSLPDSEIILRLANRMNCPLPYSTFQQIMTEIEELVPLYQGIGYAGSAMKGLSQALGTRRLHEGPFPSGFGRFSPVKYVPPIGAREEGYPLTLLTGSILFHSGTGSLSSRSSRLSKFSPEAFVEVSESDAKRLGITSGEKVKVVSRIGAVTAKAKITDTVSEGMLFMPISFPQSPVNALFGIALDSRIKNPSLKACAVRLERIEPRD